LAIKLIIEDIDAGYGAVRALHGVSLSIDNGQTVALLGTNGNGKSTLMKCVMGMVKPDKGSIRLEMDGQTHDLTQLSTEEDVTLIMYRTTNFGIITPQIARRIFNNKEIL
jgi:branched-chain amino acid transport system ATP-binding protein